jgi:hypothetical protein
MGFKQAEVGDDGPDERSSSTRCRMTLSPLHWHRAGPWGMYLSRFSAYVAGKHSEGLVTVTLMCSQEMDAVMSDSAKRGLCSDGGSGVMRRRRWSHAL